MSTGNKREAMKSDAEAYRFAGEGDTPKLLARPVCLEIGYDIPYGGGVSVDGKTVYIDRRLHQEVMDGKVAAPGLSPREIIETWIEHEHTEKAIDDGDNPCETYQAAHAVALARECHRVETLGADFDKYDSAIADGLRRTEARTPGNPPRDLWCGPYLDEPTARDKEILREFRNHGVRDAFKLSKIEVHYGMSAYECRDCRHMGPKRPRDECAIVCGLVRQNRHCDRWEQKQKTSQ